MKLRYLHIVRFKNLQDFEIHFVPDSATTVLLGQNGTGKSNLLEALIIIFRNLDLGALEHLHLYLKDERALKKLFARYNNEQAFFKALESTYISKVLKEVRIRFRRRDVADPVTFNEMSEGEQQLLMVLGLLRFTKEEEALFLLDEPDTHLNPAWSVQYFDFMKQAVGDLPSSHVMMTTHDPLVVSALKSADVRIMQRKGGRIVAEEPRENPQGMGVSNILTSELFGLRTTLDWPTQKKLDRQRELAVNQQRTAQEEQEAGDALALMIAHDAEYSETAITYLREYYLHHPQETWILTLLTSPSQPVYASIYVPGAGASPGEAETGS